MVRHLWDAIIIKRLCTRHVSEQSNYFLYGTRQKFDNYDSVAIASWATRSSNESSRNVTNYIVITQLRKVHTPLLTVPIGPACEIRQRSVSNHAKECSTHTCDCSILRGSQSKCSVVQHNVRKLKETLSSEWYSSSQLNSERITLSFDLAGSHGAFNMKCNFFIISRASFVYL